MSKADKPFTRLEVDRDVWEDARERDDRDNIIYSETSPTEIPVGKPGIGDVKVTRTIGIVEDTSLSAEEYEPVQVVLIKD